MSQESKVLTSEVKGKETFFHRLFGGKGHEASASESHSGRSSTTPLDLGDIQGFILRGYRMPMVRHFLLAVSVPAKARKLLGRFVERR